MDETLTLVRRRLGPSAARDFADGIGRSRSAQLLWVTPTHYREALRLFLEQARTSWSFTDCTSFVLMRELGIRAAFAFDRDFLEAGFDVRPGPDR